MLIRAGSNACACGCPMPRPTKAAAIIVILGALAGLGQAPWGLWPLTILAMAVWVLRLAPTARMALRQGWLFGVGYFATTLHWIVSPFLVDTAVTGWMAPFALILMAGGAAVFWAVAAYCARRLHATSVMLPVLMIAAAEAARSYVFTGFPWGLTGHIWIDTPLAQLAALVGPIGLSILTAILAASLALVWQRRYWAAFMPVLAAGAWAFLHLAPPPQYDGPVVRMVQPNANQEEKWDPVKSQEFLTRMVGFTAADARPDLVVWPETAISYLLEYADDALVEASDAARGAPMVIGINRRGGQRYYNASVVLNRGAVIADVYDKAHIVPFGEYIPGGELLAMLGFNQFSALNGGAFSAGVGARTVAIDGIGNARILICYEGIFAHEVGTDTRPRLLVLITNDAWFGPAAGPKQHLAQARLRAIEQGLPMVRVANTGISAMIDAQGRITHHIGMARAAYQDAPLPPAMAATYYSRHGDFPALLLLVIMIGLLGVMGRAKVH